MGSVYSINTIESMIGIIQLVRLFMSIFRLADFFSSRVFCFFFQVGKAAVPLLVIFELLLMLVGMPGGFLRCFKVVSAVSRTSSGADLLSGAKSVSDPW